MKTLIKLFIALLALQAALLGQTNSDLKLDTDPEQSINVKYRLFKTKNMFTFLLLDTISGKVWQVNYSVQNNVEPQTNPINEKALIGEGENSRIGRFTLYPTKNMYSFILLDQDFGRVFQCQWSMEDARMIIPIKPFPEDVQLENLKP